MTTNRHAFPRRETAGTGMPRLLTLRDITAVTALFPLGRLHADGRVPIPEAHPDRDPLDRQHRVPTVSKGEETPAAGA